MTIYDIIKNTELFKALLNNVPDADKESAIESLKQEIEHLESIFSSIPKDNIEKFIMSLNIKQEPNKQTNRRDPRRF